MSANESVVVGLENFLVFYFLDPCSGCIDHRGTEDPNVQNKYGVTFDTPAATNELREYHFDGL